MNKENIIKTLNNEQLNKDELGELLWLLDKDFYKEKPVSIEEFYSSKEFVAEKWPNIYPLWKQTLNELFPTPFNAPYNEVLISAGAGSGKCHGINTPILMADESVKMVQNIVPGDTLMGDDGTPRNVLNINRGNELLYRVNLEDGSGFVCNKSHILSLRNGFTGHVINLNIEEYLKNREFYPEYFAYKYNDNKLYEFSIEDIGNGDYYGFTIDGNHLYSLADGIVTHNTVTATISILYDIYKLGCLKDPCAYYRLSPGTMIIMAIFSATAATTKVNWEEITQGITSCPWIMRKLVDKRGVERKIGPIVPVEVIPGVFVQTGSKFQHSMGKAIFDGLMDEAAFGGANKNDAQKSYNELSSRIKTRFGKWGTKGNTPGQLFLISSPKEAGDFMQFRIEEAQKADARLTKIMQNIAVWDADPAKDSDDKFTVFIGNENKEPCIYEPDAEIPENEMDDLLYVPMSYYEDFKKDLLISIMNYGGITTTNDMALFKSPALLNEAFILNNPFNKDVVELPFNKMDKTLMDFCDMSYFNNIRHPENNRFIHIDAAYSTETLDVYGLAAGYCVLDENTILPGNTTDLDQQFVNRDRTYFIDFAVGISAPKGQEVNLGKVQDFIEYLIRHCHYPVASISADQFQSKQTLQNLETKGYSTNYISLDRPPQGRDAYLFLKYLVHNKQIMIAKNERLKQELRKIRDDGKHCDHPVGATKDIADAVAGCIWNCANSNEIINKGKIAQSVLNPTSYAAQPQSLEVVEFERLKQQFSNGIFKGF